MKDFGERVQGILEKYYPIYKDDVVESALRDLGALERVILREFVESWRPTMGPQDVRELAEDIAVFRMVERNVTVRRWAMERLFLDGPWGAP